MNALHPAWVLAPWCVALLTVGLLVRLAPAAPVAGRHASIDGLRGHLAFAVFLHHGVIWHGFLRTGRWEAPPSAFYNHLGQASVVLFFMITAFLFVGKLRDSRERPIDWLRLFVSRTLRLTPLYLLAMLGLLLLCGALSGWTLQVPASELRPALLHWLFFTIGGAGDINAIPQTFTLIAGVTWSLPLEWMFYLLLPTLALLMRRAAPWWLAGLTLLAAIGIWSHHKHPWMLAAFAGGGMAAWVARHPRTSRLARTHAGSAIVVAALVLAAASSPHVLNWRPMLALTVAFTLIAAGSDLFGALTARVSIALGELAYGIYLMHGLLLSGSLAFILTRQQAAGFAPWQHWAWLTALAPVLVTCTWLAFRWVERPCMESSDRCTHWLRARLTTLRSAGVP